MPGQADPNLILLRQNSGFGRVVQVRTVLAAAVGACDGELTLAAIAAALSALLELPPGQVAGDVLAGVRRLASDGFLSPA